MFRLQQFMRINLAAAISQITTRKIRKDREKLNWLSYGFGKSN